MDRSAPPSLALLEGPALRAVLRLAIPTTMVMALSTLTNVLYTYFVSRLGPDAIAAVSLVFPVSLLATTTVTAGLGGGTTSAIARALGAGRPAAAAHVAEQAVLLALAIGVLWGIAMVAGAPLVFGLMGGREPVLGLAVSFARIVLGGAIVTFLGAMLDSILRGRGNVRVPAAWSSVSLGLQILLTPLAMFSCGLGLRGAAAATLIAQAIALVPRAWAVFGPRAPLRARAWPWPPAMAPLREILRVGIPASMSTLVNYAGLMLLTSIVARYGAAHLAAYGLCTRFDFLLMSIAYGFATAVLTLVGLAVGAGRPERARVYVTRAGACIVGLVAIPAALLWWRPGLWVGIFSTDPGLHAVAADYFRIVGPSYPFVAVSMVLAFAFQAMGRATAPLIWMILRVTGVLASAIVTTAWLQLEVTAVFGAVSVGNVLSAAIMLALYERQQRRLRRRPPPSVPPAAWHDGARA